MRTTNTGANKKLISFSNEKLKNFIEDILTEEAVSRGITQSAVIEEYLLQSIARNYPEKKQDAMSLYREKYKYLDKFLLEADDGEN